MKRYLKKDSFTYRMNNRCHPECLCRRGRKCRYYKGHIHAFQLFRPGHEIDICRRSYRGVNRSNKSVFEVQQRRPRYRKNCRILVWGLCFPDCRGDRPAFLLPVI